MSLQRGEAADARPRRPRLVSADSAGSASSSDFDPSSSSSDDEPRGPERSSGKRRRSSSDYSSSSVSDDEARGPERSLTRGRTDSNTLTRGRTDTDSLWLTGQLTGELGRHCLQRFADTSLLWRAALASVILVAMLCELALSHRYLLGMDDRLGHRGCMLHWVMPETRLLIVTMVFNGAGAVFMAMRAWSPHFRKAAYLTGFNFLGSTLLIAASLSCRGPFSRQIVMAIILFSTASSGAAFFCFCLLALDRVEALEASMWRSLGSNRLRALTGANLILVICMVTVGVLMYWVNYRNFTTLFVAFCTILLALAALMAVFGIVATSAFCQPVRILWKGSSELKGYPFMEVQRALRHILRQLLGMLLSVSTTVFRLAVVSIINYRGLVQGLEDSDGELLTSIAAISDMLTNTAGAILLSGALMARRPIRDSASMKEQRQRRAASKISWRPCSDSAWQAKVEELACRGISLGALLDFYVGLPKVMPHFVAGAHRTRDVVWQAIIPLSCARQCSMAEIMMEGECTRPKRMVSHSWDNLFRDLVAAVVCDAVGECDFGSISYLLEHNLDALVEALRAGGKLQQTYWICAFSISQHSAICNHTLADSADTVTGKRYPICHCQAPKYLNCTPPLLTEGKSIPCELNKFVDMMAFLSASDPDFEHVVAVDAQFQTFQRAWVVAEIAGGHELGLQQHLKLVSACALGMHEHAIRHMDVRDMRASRPEDVEEILAIIPDKAAFNRHLQRLIFDKQCGLLVAWKGSDASAKMERTGRLARLLALSGNSSEVLSDSTPGACRQVDSEMVQHLAPVCCKVPQHLRGSPRCGP